uniref:Uncharacterized protein n=1 Tax=Pararge aegeria TaxID=116150 RepID=S4PYW4_9NEOP
MYICILVCNFSSVQGLLCYYCSLIWHIIEDYQFSGKSSFYIVSKFSKLFQMKCTLYRGRTGCRTEKHFVT